MTLAFCVLSLLQLEGSGCPIHEGWRAMGCHELMKEEINSWPLLLWTLQKACWSLDDALYILHSYGVQRDIEWPGSFPPNIVCRASTGEKDKGENDPSSLPYYFSVTISDTLHLNPHGCLFLSLNTFLFPILQTLNGSVLITLTWFVHLSPWKLGYNPREIYSPII